MLRPEANPIHKSRLFSEQAKAYDELENLLKCAKPPREALKKRGEELSQKPLQTPYEGFRTNRMIFIDGVAGVGKTTVYLTFRHFNKHEYVWLDALELAILDSPSNALAELLTHIERKCNEKNEGRTRLNDEQEKVLRELTDLQNKIALLWDGNPRERAARVSPQAFAAEVVDASEGRAKLRAKLNKLIDKIAKLFFDGNLLVLPIDDLHENPSVALGLLRLIRLIHSPHLVILALGNLHSLRLIEQLRARQQLTGFLHETDVHDTDMLTEVKSRAETLGVFSMSKLVCPSQTIRVYPPDTDDDKDAKSDWKMIQAFVPDGATRNEGLVQLFFDSLSKSFEAIGPIDPSTKEILDFTSPTADLRRRRIFKMPVRHLVSMHRILERGVNYPIEFCWEMLEQSRLVEYPGGLPDNVFEFDTENINRIKINGDYHYEALEREDQGPTALLDYCNGPITNEGHSARRKSVRPTVAAWAHLLLCLHDREILGDQVVIKGPQKEGPKPRGQENAGPQKEEPKKKSSKKKSSKND